MKTQIEVMLKQILAGQDQMARELVDLKRQVKNLKKRKKSSNEAAPKVTPEEIGEKMSTLLSTMATIIDKKEDIDRIKALAESKDPSKQNIVYADPGKMLKAHTVKMPVDEIEILKDYVYWMDDRGVEMTQGIAISNGLKLLFKGKTIPPRPARIKAMEKIAVGNQILGKARKLKSIIDEKSGDK
jgi:hypothetical protein